MVLCNGYKQYIADLESFVSKTVVIFYYKEPLAYYITDNALKFC